MEIKVLLSKKQNEKCPGSVHLCLKVDNIFS